MGACCDKSKQMDESIAYKEKVEPARDEPVVALAVKKENGESAFIARCSGDVFA